MRKFKLALCALALTTASASALAADTQGTVTFNGELISDTCTISSGYKDIVVELPKVSTQTLVKSGDTAGSKGFDIKVEDCPAPITQVAAHFEAIGSTGMDSTTGNLTNNFTGTGSKAGQVQVRLYNSDEQQLKLGEAGAAAAVSGGAATMRYFGGYYATGQTTAGKVQARANYTLVYP